MLAGFLGRDGFRRGMDLYFARHDGQAVTCDDFLAAMADANHVNLDEFGRWYEQAGTPQVSIRRSVGSRPLWLGATFGRTKSQTLAVHRLA